MKTEILKVAGKSFLSGNYQLQAEFTSKHPRGRGTRKNNLL